MTKKTQNLTVFSMEAVSCYCWILVTTLGGRQGHLRTAAAERVYNVGLRSVCHLLCSFANNLIPLTWNNEDYVYTSTYLIKLLQRLSEVLQIKRWESWARLAWFQSSESPRFALPFIHVTSPHWALQEVAGAVHSAAGAGVIKTATIPVPLTFTMQKIAWL